MWTVYKQTNLCARIFRVVFVVCGEKKCTKFNNNKRYVGRGYAIQSSSFYHCLRLFWFKIRHFSHPMVIIQDVIKAIKRSFISGL